MKQKDRSKPSVAMSIDDGVDAEAYSRALAQVIQEVRGENQDLERRLKERTKEFRIAQEESTKVQAELKTARAELVDAQEELKKGERMSVLGSLTATVSHELRNPLGALRTAIYMIQNKTKGMDLGLDNVLGRADRSVDRCDKIITQMLDFARSTKLKAQDAVIDQWVDSVLGEQQLLDGITVIRESEAPDVVVTFESERLRRAVINVFENGCQAIVEAMKEGDTSKQHSMTVTTRVVGDRYEIRLTDTGIGMDEKTQDKIFEPLFSTKTYGTGLGMPTVGRIMELHGGGVEVESALGEGTTIILWLPTQGANSEEAAA